MDIGDVGFELEELLLGIVDGGQLEAGVFDIKEDEPFVEHACQMAGVGDHGLVHAEVGKVGYDKLVFHRMMVMSPLSRLCMPASHCMLQV